MQGKKNKANHQVSILTQVTRMKYIPTNFIKPTPISKSIQQVEKNKTQTKSKFSFSSIFSGRNKSKIQSQIVGQSEILMPKQESVIVTEPEPKLAESISEPIPNYKLKFTCRIASEHYVIGNQFQLDLITVLGINSNRFVQTEYLWSFKFKQPISYVSADQKKFNLLAIVAGKKLYVYKYDPKKITDEKFVPFRQIILTEQPKFMQVAKDGNICILYEQRAQIRLVGQQIRIRYDKKYTKPQTLDPQKSNYTLFMVPQPYQNIVNVFFEQRKKETSKVFTLWCVQFEFLASQIRTSHPHKIYDIKIGYRNSLNIKNYSKQLFLINFGSQILALKKGYILDSATVNLKHQESCLEYIGNNTLLHISQKKIQVYSFEINVNIKPYRINIKPKDSIKILNNQKNDQYFKVLNVYANDLIIIYQKGSLNSRSKTGQIQYSFYITRNISRDQKMKQLFPRSFGQDFKIDDPVLMDKCDMAQKMGFTKRQIYLLLWNRSLQSRQQDYNILIATGDYSTIKQQIIKKLKKSSLTLTEIQKNEKNCFLMLQQRVFTSDCTEQTAMDYMSSHFFKRKLQMFTELLTMQKLEKQYKKQPIEDPSKYNKITIRQYQQIKSMQIKSQLISLVNQLCHEGKKNLSKNIRFLFRNFKFVLRTIYYQLLDQIIKNAKSNLLQLLVEIPQLLPYTPPQQQRSYILAGYYQGVWPEITRQQWSDSLYLDVIATIDNKQVILEQVVKNVNFKRNWLSQHDVILWSVEKIKQNYTKIKSCQTFYYFIAKMFETIKDVAVLQKVVQFLQNTYELPENIRGNVFLMQTMYRFFVRKNIVPEIEGRPITLSQFLSFEDKQFIRHCFQKQRSNKGLLLKDIKDLFKQVLHQQANQRYNKALLNYFISDLSQVSDLKYILNRINNQKLEFHQENQQMYEVLVQALERKMKIGTDNDIPIEEVLIYIQNIPLKFNTQSSASLDELKAVQKIDKDSQLLRQAKVNMSIYDILHDYEQVLTKLIKHAIDSSNDQVWANFQNFYNFSIQKIALLQNFSEQIYDNSYEKAIFFLYVTKICEKKERIKFADFLIKNQHFSQKLDACTVQGLVLFMKKWKLSLQKQYIKCQYYIQQLLSLLPEGSNFVQFIQSQLKFARMLSAPRFPVTYPISLGYIAASDVRDIIFDLPVDFILTVNIQQLYQNIDKMQQILIADIDEDEQQYLSPANCMTKHQIYEFFILKLIQSNKLKQVLPLIKNLLLLPIKQNNYNIVYMIMFIIQISGQFNQYNRKNILECIWFYFNQPIELHNIFQHVLNVPLSNRQVKQYIQQCLANGKTKSKGYNAMNLLFNDDYLSAIQTARHQHTFLTALQNAMNHIQHSKQQFKHIKYAAMVIMLCHQPYSLAKYISCVESHDLQLKNVQSFFSYVIQEKVFKPLSALELGRRIFLVLLQVQRNKYPLEIILQKYEQDNFDDQINLDNFTPINDHKSYQYLLWKASEAFKKKKNILQQQIINKPKSLAQSVEQKSQRIRSQLDKVANLEQRQPIQNQFNQIDSDRQMGNIQEIEENKKKKKLKFAPKFDASEQLKNALKSQNRSKLFMSTRGQIVKNTGSLSISIRQNYKSANQPFYNSIRQVPNKYKLSPNNQDNKFMDGSAQNSSPDFHQLQKRSQYHTEKQIHLRPSHSGIESEPRNSVDSSPEILIQNKANDKIIEGQQLMSSQYMIKSSHEKSHSFNDVDEQVENQYAIKVKQVYDEDQLAQMIEKNQSPDKMVQQSPLKSLGLVGCQSTQFNNPATGIIQQLLLHNKQALQNPLADFNLSVLAPYQTNTEIIINVIQQLYLSHCNMPNFNRVLRLMGQIVFTFPACNLNPQIFSTIIKAQQAQVKTIPQIKFTQLIPLNILCTQYKSKRELFQKMYYQNLSKYVDSENIYKITQFIRRVFDNVGDFEQEVTWDFILQLSDKLQNCEEQDRSWNIEKIIANLPKIQLKVWKRKITNFQTKVLGSPFKQELLKVFCGYLEDKIGDSDAIQFLQTVAELDPSMTIIQTLQSLRG